MKLPFAASCFGLVLVSQLGVSSATTTDPLSVSLSEFTSTLCDPASITDLLEPEAASACFDASQTFLSVKQFEEPKSSAALAPDPGSADHDPLAFSLDRGPTTPGPMVAVIGPIKETLVLPRSSGAKPYQVEDNHDIRRFLDQYQTGYRRAIVERWLVRAGRYLPMLLNVFK